MSSKPPPAHSPDNSREPWPARKIVVGIDGSENSQRALDHALDLARLASVPLEVVVAWDYPMGFSPIFETGTWTPDGNAKALLDDALGAKLGRNASVTVTGLIEKGSAKKVLIRRSTDAALLVIGRRGHGGFAELRLGSVASACVQHAHCTVLTVR